MALLIKIKYNNEEIKGYLHINYVSLIRGIIGMGSNLPNQKFQVQITYSILKEDINGEVISGGTHNYVWDDTQQTTNLLEYSYNELKKIESFKDSKDI